MRRLVLAAMFAVMFISLSVAGAAGVLLTSSLPSLDIPSNQKVFTTNESLSCDSWVRKFQPSLNSGELVFIDISLSGIPIEDHPCIGSLAEVQVKLIGVAQPVDLGFGEFQYSGGTNEVRASVAVDGGLNILPSRIDFYQITISDP